MRVWRIGRESQSMLASMKDHKGPVNAIVMRSNDQARFILLFCSLAIPLSCMRGMKDRKGLVNAIVMRPNDQERRRALFFFS